MTKTAPAAGRPPVRPPGTREITPRSLIAALLVAAVIGGSYPYIVMKLGFGPNISVVAAFFGYLALGIVFKDYNRWENNIVQTAGTAAGETAFLCVLMAAFDFLRQDPSLHFTLVITPLQSFLWLTTAGLLGVFLAVPMRRHFVVDEKLPFPDGIAAAETLIVLDSRGAEARDAARSMGIGTVVSALLMTLREDARVLAAAWYRIPEMSPLGPTGASMGFGVGWSLLSLGSGMLVGLRVTLSMAFGAVLSWALLPGLLLSHGAVDALVRRKVLLWVMWPATGLMVSAGLTALLLRWRTLARTFENMSASSLDASDFPMRWVLGGSLASGLALVVVQKVCLGTPVWMTLLAIAASLPLMLVSLRVLGETNWGPISVMSNLMQAVFGLVAPGQIGANMIASGVTGSIAAESEGLMQDYKTGELIGSSPRALTYAQLMAVPVGAAAVSYVYPLLRATYGIGGDHGLQSPISQKWAGFAQLLSKGVAGLPPGAISALAIAAVAGVALSVLESTRFKKWTPSPTGLGIGMLVPASAVVTMFLGSLIDEGWKKVSPRSRERHMTPLASGFIAGEAIVAVVLPILVALGLLQLQP